MKLCREYIQENSQVWQEREVDRQEEAVSLGRLERKQKAEYKQLKFREQQLRKEKSGKITDMLKELPVEEQEKLKKEQRQRDGKLLKEIKDNMWKKWRGNQKKGAKQVQIPKKEEDLDARIAEIEKRIKEYRVEQKRKDIRQEKKKKLEEHWSMMRWLTKYIEENKYMWERRRQVQMEEKEMNQIFEEWMRKDEASQIDDIKARKDAEKCREEEKMMRKEKARSRKRMWKEWRWKEGENDEKDEAIEDEHEAEDKLKADLPGEEERDLPGQGNSPPKPDKLPTLGSELGVGGAYEKISGMASLTESTAPCKAGPLDHQGEKQEEEKDQEMDGRLEEAQEEICRENERMRMEIMLGMTQEEGINCLLCLLPRCVCHITLELTKLDLKLKVMRNKDKEEETKAEADEIDAVKEEDEPGEKKEGRPKQEAKVKVGGKDLLAEGIFAGSWRRRD